MDNNMKAVFELSRAPMLAVERDRIVLANSRADELFGKELAGSPAASVIPGHILGNSSENFVTTAVFNDKPYCVSAAKSAGVLYLSMAPEQSCDTATEFVSDSLLNTMLSTLCNIGLAIDRLGTESAGNASEKQEEYLSILNHSYYYLRHSLVNLSTSISLRRGEIPFFFRTVDLPRLCSDVVSTVSVICGKRGVSIDFSTSLGELYAFADGEKVERILLNIITNSLTHTAAGGRISLSLEKSGDKAYISIDDNGSGIAATEMAELFTKYERESRSSKLSALSTGGLGLGVARGLAEGHGGALLIESREGKGTSVRIMLPLRSAELTTLESGGEVYTNSGMSLILTELAPILDSGFYTKKYTD